MILAAGMLYSMLQEPEYYHNFKIYSYSGNDIYNEQTLDNDPENQIEADAKDYEPGFHMSFSDGKETAANDIESSELVPNKFYISGIKRQIYQFIVEFTPGGQPAASIITKASIMEITAEADLLFTVMAISVKIPVTAISKAAEQPTSAIKALIFSEDPSRGIPRPKYVIK